jgi:SpoVK/Ycf46/Vps4 family AAA+-type ATPase
MSFQLWNVLADTWGGTTEFWWSEYAPIIDEITKGGKSSPEEAIAEYEKLNRRKKRKLFRLIVHLNNAEFSQQREVRDDLIVTVDDMKTLIREYTEYKQRNAISVTVQNVKVE